jgi:pimeloyl-ACP methyl ester carboxylesterase
MCVWTSVEPGWSGRRYDRVMAKVALLLAIAVTLSGQAVAPSDQFFNSNGVQIRYVEQGSGSPVVMLHGYTGTLDRHFVGSGLFAAVAKDHRAIAMDLRAHGKSGKPHDPKAYGDELAQDVVRLLDHLKIPRAHIVGYSLGAMIAGRLVTTNSDRLTSVAFIGRGPIREMTLAYEKFVEDSIREMDSDLPFRSLAVAVQPVGTPLPPDDELRKLVAPLVAVNDVKAFAAMWRGGAFLIASDSALKAAPFPMIEIVGTLDANVADVEPLRTAHPQIKTLVLEGATHGGAQSVLVRAETLAALRDLWSSAR